MQDFRKDHNRNLIKMHKTKYKTMKRYILFWGRLTISKMLISFKLIYTFNLKPKVLFKGMEGMDKIILKSVRQNYKKL